MYAAVPEHRRGLRRRLRPGDDPGDAEVHDLDLALARDHDVRRLDVAVDHAGDVRVRERLADLLRDLDGVPDVEAARPSS